MYTLKFKVEGQNITRTDNEKPVAKCRNLFTAHFEFAGAEWTGIKTALFMRGSVSKAQVLDNKNECIVPWEFFDTDTCAAGYVSVYCGDLVTATAAAVRIFTSGYTESDASVPPTTDVYQQLIGISEETKNIAQSVRDDADAGKFHGEPGPQGPAGVRGEKGDRGDVGPQGPIGQTGPRGPKGDTGAQGEQGPQGITGLQGATGKSGESAYQIAVKLGFKGTEQEWVESLKYDHSEEFTKLAEEVRNTANGIVADRQQITQNKNDVTTLKEDLSNLSPAIVDTKTGESIVVEDSSGNKLRGLSIYGKSTQVTTTGAQLLNTKELITGYYDNSGGITILDLRLSTPKIHIPTGTTKISISGLADNISALYIVKNAEGAVIERKVGYKKQHTISISPESKTIGVSFYNDANIRITADMLSSCMINFGDIKPYEPYTGGKPSPSVEYPQKIASTGDKGDVGVDVYGGNLLDISIFNDNTRNGVSGKKTDDGGYHIKGTTAEGKFFVGDHIEKSLAPGFYYISDKNNSHTTKCRLLARITNNQNIRYYHDGVFQIFENDHTELYFQVDPNTTVDVILHPMLNEGTNKMPYEPYKSAQIITIPTQNGLPGIKVNKDGNYTDATGQQWITDEIDLERGKYIQRIYSCKKEDYSIGKWNNGEYFVLCSYVLTPNTKEKAICNVANELIAMWKNRAEPHYFLQRNNQKVIIAFGVDYCFSEVEMRKVLDKGLEFKYILETPIERDLTPEEIQAYKALHSNYPTTVILNDENAGMEVSYVADTKNYIDKKFAELNQAIVNTQISLL